VLVADGGAVQEFVAAGLGSVLHGGVHGRHLDAGGHGLDAGGSQDLAGERGEFRVLVLDQVRDGGCGVLGGL
jgi:hypothetical protein